MRGLVVATATLAFACLAGCSSSKDAAPPNAPSDDPPSAAFEGALRINELKVLGSHDAAPLPFEGALEIVNVGDSPVHLGSYAVRVGFVETTHFSTVMF